jgi:hypothetical protein
MKKKQAKTIEVIITLTPEQLRAVNELYPNEISFTRKFAEWNVTGRRRVDKKAKKLELDKESLRVIPDDDRVPAFIMVAK